MYGAETLPAITTGEDFVTASSKMMTVKKDAEMDEGKPKGVLAGSLGGLAKQMTLLIQTNLLQNEILFSIKDVPVVIAGRFIDDLRKFIFTYLIYSLILFQMLS